MLEIIALIFLCRRIGNKAIQKGLKPGQWKFLTVVTWIVFEMVGVFIAIILFGFDRSNLIGLMAFSVACAFGGYLIIQAILDKKPDQILEDDINNIGNEQEL